jgi:ABC-2 type transport system ATP-binding protein
MHRLPLLEVERLTKRYPGGLVANDAINLDIAAGEVFGLLGPNGAGKTTLVGQLLGLLKPTSGTIRINRVDVVARPGEARRLCSYQPQGDVPVQGLTPLEAIELAGRLRGGDRDAMRRRASTLLNALDLGDWASHRRPLSGGVARLVGFCMAAVHPGQVVVLDEPTNDVDPLRRKLLWRLVRELADSGSAILLVTHNVLEAERCVDRLAVLNRGRIAVAGTPAMLRADVGDALRLELVIEPGHAAPAAPDFVRHPLSIGTRVVGAVGPDDVTRAVAWASDARRQGSVSEFLLTPVSLEDVYARAVGDADADSNPGSATEVEHAALV